MGPFKKNQVQKPFPNMIKSRKRAKTKHEHSKKIEQHNAIGVFTKNGFKNDFCKIRGGGPGEEFFPN